MAELREAHEELDALNLDVNALVPPSGEVYVLTEHDKAVMRRAGDAWKAYVELATQRWHGVEDL